MVLSTDTSWNDNVEKGGQQKLIKNYMPDTILGPLHQIKPMKRSYDIFQWDSLHGQYKVTLKLVYKLNTLVLFLENYDAKNTELCIFVIKRR